MADAGYIYALINPSLEGLVKVGKTRRDPTHRVKELSSSTAAPTPFVLAFDVYVDNCSAAESYLHTLLAKRGYRVSENREFFKAPLKEVIKVMLEVEGSPVTAGTTPDRPAPPRSAQGPEAEAILEEAQAYYQGEGDTIEDKKEALKLFKQAARLGAPDAFYALGVMYRDGEGCDRNTEEALEYLKTGVAKGSDECHAEMALLFLQEGHNENARKCWSKYFRSDGFAEGLSGHEAAYGHAYLVHTLETDSPPEHQEALRRYDEQIRALVDDAVRAADPEAKPALKRQRRQIRKCLGMSRW
jgi:TPR repeat protein